MVYLLGYVGTWERPRALVYRPPMRRQRRGTGPDWPAPPALPGPLTAKTAAPATARTIPVISARRMVYLLGYVGTWERPRALVYRPPMRRQRRGTGPSPPRPAKAVQVIQRTN